MSTNIRHIYSPAQMRALKLIATYGKVERFPSSHSTYVWKVDGLAISGVVDTLIRKGALDLSPDKNTATLSDLGREVYRRSRGSKPEVKALSAGAARITCTECGHFFDPSDKRALVFEERPDLANCPACAILGTRSREAWAVYNSCQGVFACGVAHSKKDAEARLKSGDYDGAGCTVVPVRVIVEPEDRKWIREWKERELRS